jgi:hypothetical protein
MQWRTPSRPTDDLMAVSSWTWRLRAAGLLTNPAGGRGVVRRMAPAWGHRDQEKAVSTAWKLASL